MVIAAEFEKEERHLLLAGYLGEYMEEDKIILFKNVSYFRLK